MSDFKIQCVQDLAQAKFFWELLNPNDDLWSNWDFRYCFYKYFSYPLFFYVGYIEDQPIGLLPLVFNTHEKRLEHFGESVNDNGGGYFENNDVYIKPGYESYIPQFYMNIDQPISLSLLSKNHANLFTLQNHKYTLSLKPFPTFNDYIMSFKQKSRGRLRRKIKSIEEQKVGLVKNQIDDLEHLFRFNIEIFNEKSAYLRPHMQDFFKDLAKSNFDIHLLTFIVGGKKEGVSLSIFYKDTYYFLSFATNRNAIPGLGTYVCLENIKHAIDIKATLFDAGEGNWGWKEELHMEKIPFYQFSRP